MAVPLFMRYARTGAAVAVVSSLTQRERVFGDQTGWMTLGVVVQVTVTGWRSWAA